MRPSAILSRDERPRLMLLQNGVAAPRTGRAPRPPRVPPAKEKWVLAAAKRRHCECVQEDMRRKAIDLENLLRQCDGGWLRAVWLL